MGAESWRVGLNTMTRLGRLTLLVALCNKCILLLSYFCTWFITKKYLHNNTLAHSTVTN